MFWNSSWLFFIALKQDAGFASLISLGSVKASLEDKGLRSERGDQGRHLFGSGATDDDDLTVPGPVGCMQCIKYISYNIAHNT